MYALIFALIFGGNQSAADVEHLLQGALKNEAAVFASDYLHDAFAAWQVRHHVRSFAVDTAFEKGEYHEAHVRFSSARSNESYPVAVLFRNGKAGKIVDIRKKMVQLRSDQPDGHKVVEFIERLAWLYDTGEPSFVMDIFYPEYVNLRYSGLDDKKMILETLQERFEKQLPITGFSWEKRGAIDLLSIELASTLEPLEIAVDLQKHGTARFFDFADKSERSTALLDSMRTWRQAGEPSVRKAELIVAAPDVQEAVRRLTALAFQPYTVQIEKRNEDVWSLRASLEGIAGFSPTDLSFDLMIEPDIQGQFIVQPSWVAPKNLLQKFRNAQNATFGNGSSYAQLLSQTVHRYATLALPSAFRPAFEKQQLAGKIYLHNTRVDSIVWRSAGDFERILTGLADEKVVSFYPGTTEIRGKSLWVSGHAVFQDTRHLWYHIAKIREQYRLAAGTFSLYAVDIDLHAFVRTENIKDAFADEEPLPREGAGIPVKRK